MPSLLATGKQQYFDNTGIPLVGGKLYTYAAGTTAPRATFADNQGNVANPNPVILDGRGEAVVFWSGSYDVVLKDALDNVIWAVSNVTESNLGARTSSTGSMVIPAGTVAQRDVAPVVGYLRYNVDLNCYESFAGGVWSSLPKSINGGGVPDGGDIKLKTVAGNSITGTGDITIKTVGGTSLIGAGDIVYKTVGGVSLFGAGDIAVQSPLVSGINVKTINGASILAAGDVPVQVPLVSGGNIKTINGTSVLGAGDIPTAASIQRSARIANTMLVASDIGKFIDITAGTFIQTFDTAAALGNGWSCYIHNGGIGNITIPSSDGIANWIMYPGELRLFQCDGTNLTSAVLTPFTIQLTTSATFIRPPGYANFDSELWGAGGGGAGGGGGASGGGGGGGGYIRRVFSAIEVGASALVTVGAGGSAGTGLAATYGSAGGAGGNTTFLGLTATGGTGGPSSLGGGSGGVGASINAEPYVGGNAGSGINSGASSPGIGKFMAGSGGGAGSFGTYASLGTGGIRIGAGTAAAAGTASVGGAGQNGVAFGGGGGGGGSSTGAGGNAGNGGTASGGGGGGASINTSFAGGNGGAGGSGYVIIRGV